MSQLNKKIEFYFEKLFQKFSQQKNVDFDRELKLYSNLGK